jgi:hypothetical protein
MSAGLWPNRSSSKTKRKQQGKRRRVFYHFISFSPSGSSFFPAYFAAG